MSSSSPEQHNDYSNLKRQLAETRNLLIHIEEQNKSLIVKNEYANSQINLLKKEKEKLQQEIDKLNQEIHLLKNNFNTETLKIEEIYIENEYHKSLLEKNKNEFEIEKQKLIEEFTQKINLLETKLSETQNFSEQKYKHEISEYQTKINQLENIIKTLPENIHQEYKERFEKLTEEYTLRIQSIKNEMSSISEHYEEKIIQLNIEKQNHEQQIKNQFQNIIEQLEQQIDKKQKETEIHYQNKLKESEQLLSEKDNQISQLKLQTEQLLSDKNQSIENLQSIINKHQQSETQYQKEIHQLKEELQNKNIELSALNEEINKIQTAHQSIIAENQLMQTQIDALLIQAENTTKKHSKDTEHIHTPDYLELLSQNQTLSQDNDNLSKQILQLQNQNNELIKEKESLIQNIQQLQAQLMDKQSCIEKLEFQSKNNPNADDYQILKTNYEQLQTQINQFKELEQVNHTLEQQIIELQAQLATIIEEFNDYKTKNRQTFNELENEYLILLDENEKISFQLQTANEQIKLLQDELNETITKHNARHDELKTIINEHLHTIHQYEHQIKTYETTIEKYEKELQFTKSEMIQLLDIQDIMIQSLKKIQKNLSDLYSNENHNINISNLDKTRKQTIFAPLNIHTELFASVQELNEQIDALFNEKT